MTRARRILLTALAACLVGGVGAAPALAGPVWVVEGSELEAGKTSNTTARKASGSGNFKLKTSLITIECKSATSTGTIIGGVPGTGTAKVKFTECFVKGKTEAECHVNSPGESVGTIVTEAKRELVYLGSETEAKKEEGELGLLFSPKSGETFVEIQVNGTKCPLFTKGGQEVKGNVIAEVAPVNSEAKVERLIFPAPPITKAFRWIKAGEVEEVKASLKAFGIIGVELIGEAEVELEGKEQFGPLAALVKITVQHIGAGAGGKPRFCAFAIKFEKCEIEVKNISPFKVEIISATIEGPAGRFKLTPGGCSVGTVLESTPPGGAGSTCMTEVEPVAEPAAAGEWKNNRYTIWVEQTAGAKTKTTGGLALFM
jgi:hypothetical protein